MLKKKPLCDTLKTGDTLYLGNKLYTLEVADTFLSRFFGLMGRKSLPADRAMLITKCSSIHTFFMRFRMTAVFLSGDMRVTKIVPDMAPWRMAFATFTKPKTACVLEIASGSISVREGDTITGILKGKGQDLAKTEEIVPAGSSSPSA